MKKKLFLFISFLTLLSCSSSDTENIISCLFEGTNLRITSTTSSTNSKEVSFTLTYTGDETLDNSIIWDFGDGTTGTFSGTTTTHVYMASGTYKVVAKPTLRNVDAFCSVSKEKDITIN